MEETNPLYNQIAAYISEQEKQNEICSIDKILQITSDCVKEFLPADQTASVELHHFEPWTTVIITIPGDTIMAKQSPYTFKIRTSR